MDLQSIPYFMANRVMTDPLLDIVIIFLVVALVRTVFLSMRITKLMRGADGKSLESTIHTLDTRARVLEEHAKKTERALNNLDSRVRRSIRGVAVKRFDPFQNAGGQQSFTSAFVDEDGSGVVISGIHARDSVRVYAKEVQKFTSDRELSDDERAAIQDAQKRLQ